MSKLEKALSIALGIVCAAVIAISIIKIPKEKVFIVPNEEEHLHQIDSLNNIIESYKDSVIFYKSACSDILEQHEALIKINSKNVVELDSLKADNFVKEYKLGRIKNYCEIVRKNSSQVIYLRGWINRVLED